MWIDMKNKRNNIDAKIKRKKKKISVIIEVKERKITE